MATRQFLYQTAEGFYQTQGATDDITLGKVTATGVGGVAFDASGQLISNVATPVSGTDAANKTYVDGATTVTAGAGLSKTGSQLDVEVDSSANAQGAGTGGGSSGLEFDTSGAAGKVRAAVNATAGLQRTASGLGVLLDNTPTTLSSSASGIKVVGLPSLFQINNSATSSNVTAANLGTLTAGTSSSSDALHRHDRIDGQFTADEAIAVADAINWSSVTSGRVIKGRADTDAKSRVHAIARSAAAGAGNTLDACAHGPCPGVLTGATQGDLYYLQATGGIGTTVPGTGNRTIQVGIAMNATDLYVKIIDYGKH